MNVRETDEYYKLPRLFTSQKFAVNGKIELSTDQAHYLRNVLRMNTGDYIRIFNGQDGEYLTQIDTLTKKAATVICLKQLKPQPQQNRRVHLIFSPIKKHRQDMLIEKVVELGVTDIHPVFMARTQGKNFKRERVSSQIIEAAEQCERFSIPELHGAQPLQNIVANWNHTKHIYWANERGGKQTLSTLELSNDVAFIIGPEGGFSKDECDYLETLEHITPFTLGETIYRVETAAILCLAKTLDLLDQ